MKGKKGYIWNEGEWWKVNDYNERLSKENKEIDRVDKIVRKLKSDRDKKLKGFWKK